MVEMLQLYGTPEESPDSVAEVRVGANRGRDWGEWDPSQERDTCQVVASGEVGPVLGWLQENVREVSDTEITSKFPTV
ncbi:hypothetical protein GBAR_LOCUS16919 [Geodia barretti]|uniref:Uncharacterized protein n=1 Tax=Geodia barretti TaxID=519541 RepID=A0AA35WQ86_GEOBA|nr:hypothetical protein GBAR_LOCUS16919 [Geodia barretti]